ncbi:MAG: HupE/UreJ family protein [Bacteroidota bacterium]
MKINLYYLNKLLIGLAMLCLPFIAAAHEPDQSYLYLRIYGDAMGGRFEVVAKDLNRSIGINLPDQFSMEDLEPYVPRIQDYLKSVTTFSYQGKTYPISFDETEVFKIDEMAEDFALFSFTMENVDEVPDALDIRYEGFFDKNPIHKGMLVIGYNWKAGIVENTALISLIFGPNNPQQTLSLTEMSVWKGFWALIKLGVWHIWIGLDHILFIIALILPAVVRRRETLEGDFSMVDESVSTSYSKSWLPVAKFKPAFFYILKIVTFFTIAHSITLALASLEIVSLPSRWVESIIAFSIALAALHNITPIFKGKEWAIAFIFGLFHGFGFASVLGDKGLGGDFMVLSLFGFNIGVEIGQVLIICLAFPVLFLIRKTKLYPKIITYGSALLIVIAMYWVIERAFEVDLPAGKYLRDILRFVGLA